MDVPPPLLSSQQVVDAGVGRDDLPGEVGGLLVDALDRDHRSVLAKRVPDPLVRTAVELQDGLLRVGDPDVEREGGVPRRDGRLDDGARAAPAATIPLARPTLPLRRLRAAFFDRPRIPAAPGAHPQRAPSAAA